MKIPIIINNRNLLTYPSKMMNELKSFDNVGDIIIVDNGSTYEPLLEWYETKPCEIIRTTNNGHLSPWVIGLPEKLNSEFYVVTDPDLDLSITPKDSLLFLEDKMRTHSQYCKIGLSLKNWEVSENSPYHTFLKNWAKTNWDVNSVNDGLLVNQKNDTTFALYHINRHYRGNNCTTYLPYSANHIPWDFTYEMLNNIKTYNYEYYFYLLNSSSSSSYKKFIKFNEMEVN
jgi:hypothetical protein